MAQFKREKVHTRFLEGVTPVGPNIPRRYTLTHSDRTGDLFLTVGQDYERRQVSGLYTRLMRDEVVAEWVHGDDGYSLQVHCHVSGGWVIGSASWRNKSLQREIPLALQAFRYGDSEFFKCHPELDTAPVFVYFHAKQAKYDREEQVGSLQDYKTSPNDKKLSP